MEVRTLPALNFLAVVFPCYFYQLSSPTHSCQRMALQVPFKEKSCIINVVTICWTPDYPDFWACLFWTLQKSGGCVQSHRLSPVPGRDTRRRRPSRNSRRQSLSRSRKREEKRRFERQSGCFIGVAGCCFDTLSCVKLVTFCVFKPSSYLTACFTIRFC